MLAEEALSLKRRACAYAHLPLEVQQPEGLELNGRFGSQIPGQGPGKVFKFLNSVCDSSLQPGWQRQKEGEVRRALVYSWEHTRSL